MVSDDNNSEKSVWPRLVLRRADQAVAATLTAMSLAAIALWCLWEWRMSGRLIDIERAEPVAIDFRIDVNDADWPELAVLPNIGEQLAKRIVAHRAEHGPFRDMADLQRVRGIGPRTAESMQTFLLPLSGVEATAGTQPGTRLQAVD